jgi:sigma-B regulation protein RsbU (phosphoserine phosphatase)
MWKKRSRIELIFLALAALWVLLALTRRAPGFSAFIAFVEIVLGVVLVFRLIRYVARQTIWRLRNRLIVTYFLIGVIPVVLILILVGIGSWIIAGQVAVFLVSSELNRRIEALNEPAQVLSWSSPETRERILKQVQALTLNHFPNAQILIHAEKDLTFPKDAKMAPPPEGWKNARGLVVKNGVYYEWAHVIRDQTEVVMMEPVTNRLLSELVPHLGQVLLAGSDEMEKTFIADSGGHGETYIPPSTNPYFDREVTWPAEVKVADWDRPGKERTQLLVVTTRPSALLAAIFGEQFEVGQFSLYAFLIVAISFLIVELLSLVAGISLTRTITGAVHNLYQGTQMVTAGDFSHRIDVRGKDQLASLSASFNSMSENLERLFAVEKEKERLQSELEIAKEVQAQLFPKDVPILKTMQLTGLCKPARMVSGDYYDFFCLNDTKIALAIGDVAGKGISAALLMAAIQSIMRAQLMHSDAGGDRNPAGETARAVSLLNRQLFANTSPEKYATFCFGIYDEESRVLSYTNAGHLQPLLVRGRETTLLEVTGTVVGAFANVKYEERTVALQPGDLLVAYTDGIAEPENEYGEQFGEERLTDLLLRHQGLDSHEIIARVMESVIQWTNAPELPDDMTLLVAKVH